MPLPPLKFRLCAAAGVLLATLPAVLAGAPTARENFSEHCRGCHGVDGKSQTRMGRKSGAKDLSDKKNQAKLTDEDAFRGIKFGRKNAKGEEKMDSFGHVLSDQEITELVAYVRTLAKESP